MKKIYLLTFLSFVFLFGISDIKAEEFVSGTYKIVSAFNDNMVLTSSTDGNIQLNTDKNENNQLWDVKLVGGSYIITSKADTNKSFDIAYAKTANGTNIRLYQTNGTNAQKWAFKSCGDGYYYIVSKLNGNKALDIYGGRSIENANVQLYQSNGTKAQKFKLVEIIENKKTLDDGTYIITSKLSDKMAMSLSNTSNVNISQANSSYKEAWNVKYLDGGYYEISSYSDNKLLSIEGNRVFNSANVAVANDTSDYSKWIIKENFDGTYSVVSNLNHYYLDIKGAKTTDGTNIQMYQGNGTNAQKFNFTKVDFEEIENGIYTISTFNNDNLVLALNNEVTLNGGNVELAKKGDSNNQKWSLEKVEENVYEIKSVIDNSFVFDVSGANVNNGANVQIYKTNGTKAQRWRIVKVGENLYRFTNVNSNKNLDVKSGKISNGSNIWQYENNNTNAQKFKLTKTTKTNYSQIIENGSYIIYSAVNLNKSLRYSSNVFIYDVEGSSKEIMTIEYAGDGYYYIKNGSVSFTNNNGKITMSNYAGNDNQKWFAVKTNDYYTFVSKTDGKVLDIPSASMTNNNNLQTYVSNGTNAQKFYLEAVVNNDLNDGYYNISIDDKYIGLNREIAYNGSIPIIGVLKNDSTQKWYIKRIRNNTYEIKYALNPNKVLDVKGGKTANGTYVQTYTSNSTNSQRWNVIALKDGSYKFISNISHTCLTIDGNNTKIYSNDKNKTQRFKLTTTNEITVGQTVEDGYYTISTVLNTSKVLDIKNGSIKTGTNVQLYTSTSAIAQIWKLYYSEDGLYYIISGLSPQRALTNVNGNVQSEKYTGADNQKWYVKMLENNQVSLISASDSLYVDVAGGKANNQANVQVYQGNNTNAQKFVLNSYGGTKYYHGADVSRYQGNIDWNKLTGTDTNFVIIRAGYGMYSDQKDSKFEEYYKNAKNYDLAVGAYTYSYARSVDEAKREANETLGWIKGKKFELPIFYDLEDKSQTYLGKNTLTKMAETFCNTILSNGYQCGIYANKNWLTNYLDASYLASKYPIWLAHYTNGYNYTSYNDAINHYESNYNGSYKYWQFSSVGKLSGVSGSVDLDFGYDIFD